MAVLPVFSSLENSWQRGLGFLLDQAKYNTIDGEVVNDLDWLSESSGGLRFEKVGIMRRMKVLIFFSIVGNLKGGCEEGEPGGS